MSAPPRLRVVTSLKGIDAAAWDACAEGEPPGKPPSPALESISQAPESASQQLSANPFISHAFLTSLEDAACVGGRSGWSPAYLLAEDGEGRLVGATPSYLKSHSQGEYVFDHAWADAYQRAGGRYYPKIQIASPFTPAMGPRLLVRGGASDMQTRAQLIAGLESLREQTQSSSLHVTFAAEPDIGALEAAGYLLRHDIQYHWQDESYGDYEGFLAALASRKRKAIRRERREAVESGIIVETLTGAALTEAHWDAFFSFYEDTGSRKWGRPYLNRRFFSLIGERMAPSIVLMLARRAGRYIAGALNFRGGQTLYGRYWGATEHHPFLHFELCYHRAIDYALTHGLTRVEAGAQGEHKLARGYRPVITTSLHAIADPGLRRAVAQYLRQERADILALHAELDAQNPFRKEEAP